MYATKPDAYFDAAREDYVAELPTQPNLRVLELGCGTGATGALALSLGRASVYVGIEIHEQAACRAMEKLTAVHIGNVDALELPYRPGTFDALICSEVLEHLSYPETTLRRLTQLLRVGGRVYASSPNIAHWRVISDLVAGKFDYGEAGTMDATHLRWFTPQSFRALFEDASVRVDRVAPLRRPSWSTTLMQGMPLGHLAWRQIDLRGTRLP